ncbi:MAG: hypothetical protein OHK0052_16480 [Anaerolineales bacterium]
MMTEKAIFPPENSEQTVPPALPAPQPEAEPAPSPEELRKQRRTMIGLVVIVVVLLATFIGSIVFLLQPGTDTARIRDIFIIIMALQSLLIGFVLVILMVQLARLINLLQNEIKPILESTNHTVNTLRGTTIFLSDNLSEPIIKLNEYVAALSRLVDLLRPGKIK